jgi:translation elongation factor EF-Tu-like GTPase
MIPQPERDKDKPFLMPIEDVFPLQDVAPLPPDVSKPVL